MKPFIVYGTLRPGHHNYQWALFGQTISEETVTIPNSRLTTNGGFPFLVPSEGEVSEGTLVTVDDFFYKEVLANLDHLEGYREGGNNNLYDRVVVEVATKSGEMVEAWLYVPAAEMLAHASRLPAVAENNWNRHVHADSSIQDPHWLVMD